MAGVRYVALLRAVNVGKRQVSMPALKAVLEDLGYEDVQTVLQSGNVVFSARRAAATELERRLSTAIGEAFGFDVPVMVRTGRQLDAVIAANPWPEAAEADPKSVHVAFASGKVPASAYAGVDRAAFAPDDFRVGTNELYLLYPNGSGRSKMKLDVEGVRHLAFTARNWNTVRKLRDLAVAP